MLRWWAVGRHAHGTSIRTCTQCNLLGLKHTMYCGPSSENIAPAPPAPPALPPPASTQRMLRLSGDSSSQMPSDTSSPWYMCNTAPCDATNIWVRRPLKFNFQKSHMFGTLGRRGPKKDGFGTLGRRGPKKMIFHGYSYTFKALTCLSTVIFALQRLNVPKM